MSLAGAPPAGFAARYWMGGGGKVSCGDGMVGLRGSPPRLRSALCRDDIYKSISIPYIVYIVLTKFAAAKKD